MWLKLVRDHYFYSGGSLRYFCLSSDEIKNLVDRAFWSWDEVQNEVFELVSSGLGARSGASGNRRRRQYVVDVDDEVNYRRPRYRFTLVDSGYALRRLGLRANVSSHVELYKQAKTIGTIFEQIAFEQLVHRFIPLLTHKPWEWDLRPKSATIRIKTSAVGVSCRGETEAECLELIKSLPWGTYWYPEYPSFPFIDAIMPCKMYEAGCTDGEDVVVYVHVTMSKEKTWNEERFHDVETAIAANASLKDKKRVFLVVTPSAVAAERFQMGQLPPRDKCVLLVSYVEPNKAVEDAMRVTFR